MGTDRNRTRCVPNCVTFPASRSTPVTVCARSVMTVSQFVFSRQSAPPCTMTRRIHVSFDGLFSTVANTRRASARKLLKRRVRRNVKAPKAVAGLSYTELLAKKQQKPEIRQKQRDNAIKAAKEKKKASDAAKAAARKAIPKVQSKAQAKMPKAP